MAFRLHHRGRDSTAILDQFEFAERVEEAAGRLYRLLAVRFGNDAEARALFERLADEEQQHALRVRMLRSRFLRDSRTVGPITLDLAKARAVLADAERLAGALAGNEPEPATVDAALAVARDLEERLAFVHADIVAQGCHPEFARLLTSLAEQDRQHAALLLR